MKTIQTLLKEAIKDFRQELKKERPIDSDIKINEYNKITNRDWSFKTNLKEIITDININNNIQEKYDKIISQYWTGDSQELIRDTLHYLLYHELYHKLYAPFSITGEKSDNKQIHQAIRRGVIAAEPDLKSRDQLNKVINSQNVVKDFIVDNKFMLDNLLKKYVHEDIIPAFDFLELNQSEPHSNHYSITRLIYSALYGPQSTYEYFDKKSGEKGFDLAEESLSSLLNYDIKLPRGGNIECFQHNKKTIVKSIDSIFTGDDRYQSIERFMTVLGPYVNEGSPQGNQDMDSPESGGGGESILQDLIDDMTPDEKEEFLLDLLDDEDPKNDNNKKLQLFTAHEFYKHNHPKINLVCNDKEGQKLFVGKEKYFSLKSSEFIKKSDLDKVNISELTKLQQRTKLPWLIKLNDNAYRLNDWEIKERDINKIVYVDKSMNIPDIVEFYIDSSGSMFDILNEFPVNDGSRWDMLNNVLYGFVDALNQGGKINKKDSLLRFHNFAEKQLTSDIISTTNYLKGNQETLKIVFQPDNGFGYEDINITDFDDHKKRAYVIVSDGNLCLEGRSEREANKMIKLSNNENNRVILFEIGDTYELGKIIKNHKNINYLQVHNKEQMFARGIDILLSK